MKKFTLSVAAVMAMSTFAIAGGDIAPVEPVVEAPVAVASDAGFYAGIAYGAVSTEFDASLGTEAISLDIDHSTIMFQAGYQFNTYLAVEGRYWTAVSDADTSFTYTDSANPENNEYGSEDLDDDSNAWGIYLKPMYPVANAFTVYGLVGYGNVELDIEGISSDESSFQWGLGGSYDVNDNFAVFVDYVSLYDDDDSIDGISGDVTVDSWNFGVTYKF